MAENLFKNSRPLYGQDPHVTKYLGDNLLCESLDEKQIALSYLSLDLKGKSEPKVVWERESEEQVWAPELHQIDGLWYIYYASSNGDNRTHRTMVAGAAMNPFGPYHFSVPVGPDVWGIDMTVFPWNGKRYAVWSGWENNGDEFPQHLFIAPLLTPVELGNRVRISSPEMDWELGIAPINEGPQAFVDPPYHDDSQDGTLYLLYSANASWTPDYATGILELVGEDPLNPRHWLKCPFPLLTNAGHGQLVDGHFVYHRKMSFLPGWSDRQIVTMPRGELLGGMFRRFKGEV